MNKGRVIGLLKQHGDAVLTSKSKEGLQHQLCTIDFKNKYIKQKTKGKKPWPKNKTDIVVFNWTINRYWILNPADIVKVIPLSEILKNVAPK